VIVPLIETDTQAAPPSRRRAFRRTARARAAACGPSPEIFARYLRGGERPHRGRRDDRDTARRAQRRRDRRYPGIDFVLIGTGDLAISLRRLSERRCTPRAGVQDRVRGLQGGGVPCGIFTMSVEAAANGAPKATRW
jgi:2-dehydro-3-deoxyglucarate aldolase/4-hydroxy-2-oxoheptanedioate aldolase